MSSIQLNLTSKVATLADRLKLRHQIGLAAAALCVFVVAVIAGATAYIGGSHYAAFVRYDLAETAQVLAERLDRTVWNRYREVRTLASLDPLKPLWQGDPAALRRVMDQFQESYPDYSWIGYATADGIVRASARGLLDGVSVAARPWFQNGLHGPAIEDVHEAQLLAKVLGPTASGEPFRFVDIAFPVRDARQKVTGVFGVHLSWEFAASLRQSMLSTIDRSNGADLIVLARDGKVLLGA